MTNMKKRVNGSTGKKRKLSANPHYYNLDVSPKLSYHSCVYMFASSIVRLFS